MGLFEEDALPCIRALNVQFNRRNWKLWDNGERNVPNNYWAFCPEICLIFANVDAGMFA